MTNGAIGVRANTVGVMAASQASRSARKASWCSAWVDDHDVEVAPRVGGARADRSADLHLLHPGVGAEHLDGPVVERRGTAGPPTSNPPIASSSVAVAGELVAAVAGSVLVGARRARRRSASVSSSRWNGRTRKASAPDWNENDAVLRAGRAQHDARRAHPEVVMAADGVEHLEARADAAGVEVEDDAPGQLVGDAAGGLVGAGGADGVDTPCVPTMRTSISQAAGSSFTTSTFGAARRSTPSHCSSFRLPSTTHRLSPRASSAPAPARVRRPLRGRRARASRCRPPAPSPPRPRPSRRRPA